MNTGLVRRVYATALLALPLLLHAAHAQVTFTASVPYPTGSSPDFVASGDLNRDGRKDIVVTNYQSSTVSVFLALSTGGYLPALTFPTGAGPTAAAVGDVTGDGIADVVVCNGTANSVTVLAGAGDGTLRPTSALNVRPPTASAAAVPVSLALVDLNGDGRLDLVTANQGMNTVSVLMNIGGGTFALPVTYNTGTTPVSLFVADLNGNGKPDIVTANKNSRDLSILMNNGDGTFGPARSFTGFSVPYWVTGSDVNGDGVKDLVVADNIQGTYVLLGHGDGTFDAPSTRNLLPGSSTVITSTGDFNGDNKPDVASLNLSTRDVSIFIGSGDGTFQKGVSYAGGATRLSMLVSDLNGDGIDDLCLTSATSTMGVWTNVTSTVQDVSFSPNPVASGAVSVATIALARPAPAGGVTVALGNGNPNVAWVPDSLFIPEGQATGTFRVAANPGVTGTVPITATLSSITKSVQLGVVAAPPPPPATGLTGDLNNDGKIDILDLNLLARIVGGMSAAPASK